MRRSILALLLALAVFGGIAAAPQPASAACIIAQGNLQWHTNGYKSEMSAQGCGTVSLQTCIQNTAGTTYGCRTWNGSGAGVQLWSLNASTGFGCTQRARGWSNIYGWWTGAWVNIC